MIHVRALDLHKMFYVKQWEGADYKNDNVSRETIEKTTSENNNVSRETEERLLIITNVSRETLRETKDLVQNNLYILLVVSSESTAQKSIT